MQYREFAPLVGAAVTVTSTAPATNPVPHCRVKGYVTTQNPGPNRVNFSLSLPDSFNGRYLLEAIGGSAGYVQEPTPSLMSQGYALAATDQGTRPASNPSWPSTRLDFEWRSDPAQLADYNHRGIHVVAQATQRLTDGYYASKARRYIAGCSGGGRSGRMSAIRYPGEDFDGILAGAAPSSAANQIAEARIVQYMYRHPDSWISPELMARASQRIIAEYDEADGAKDGVIQDERNFDFDVRILREVGFTQAQIDLVQFVRAPFPYLSAAAPASTGGYAPGWSIAMVTEWTDWFIGRVPPPWTMETRGAPRGFLIGDSTLRAIKGSNFDWTKDVDFSDAQDFQAWTNGVGEVPVRDYRRFAESGAKLSYHGVGDSAVSTREAIVARQEANRFAPDQADWNRLYFIPGWGHCVPTASGGASGAEVRDKTLSALVAWVELGQAPTSLLLDVPAAAGNAEKSQLICPEPQTAKYKGGGLDINKAENWSCQQLHNPALR